MKADLLAASLADLTVAEKVLQMAVSLAVMTAFYLVVHLVAKTVDSSVA